MLSKSKTKFIVSLRNKKSRDEEGLFVIEGDKLVKEFLSAGVHVKSLFAKPEFLKSLPSDLSRFADETETVGYEELKTISSLKTPHNAIAVVPVPEVEMNISKVLDQLCVVLDNVQDPGNMGTIIRAAGWFGIKNIVCSDDCVNVYNPKVIQASMGAILHVSVVYSELKKLLAEASASNIPVFGTFLEGKSVYTHMLGNKGIIIFGNESKGISHELIPFITDKIMIPRYSTAKLGIDSLNVGMAASIVFSEFRRRSGNTPD